MHSAKNTSISDTKGGLHQHTANGNVASEPSQNSSIDLSGWSFSRCPVTGKVFKTRVQGSLPPLHIGHLLLMASIQHTSTRRLGNTCGSPHRLVHILWPIYSGSKRPLPISCVRPSTPYGHSISDAHCIRPWPCALHLSPSLASADSSAIADQVWLQICLPHIPQ